MTLIPILILLLKFIILTLLIIMVIVILMLTLILIIINNTVVDLFRKPNFPNRIVYPNREYSRNHGDREISPVGGCKVDREAAAIRKIEGDSS
jgi:hypothetical protein